MLQVSSWVRILVAVVVLAGIIIALPNALPQSVLDKYPHWLPRNTVTLGLDLQGGSHVLFEVGLDSVIKDKIESLQGLTAEAEQAREALIRQIQRIGSAARRLADRAREAADRARTTIADRKADISTSRSVRPY